MDAATFQVGYFPASIRRLEGTRKLGIIGLIIGPLLVSGCVFMAPSSDVVPASQPPVVDAPVQASPAPPVSPPVIAPRPQPLRTAVLLSDDISEYAQVVDEIRRRGSENLTVHNFDGRADDAARVIAEIKNANPDRLVAIGLLAATVARRIPDVPVVFCQIYNYQDHDLLAATSKGVHLLPPFDLQLRAWRALAPDLRRVGIVTGPGQDALIAEMQQAIAEFEIELTVRTVYSDKGLVQFKRLTPAIQASGCCRQPHTELDRRARNHGVQRQAS
jgi:hypothetical protein